MAIGPGKDHLSQLDFRGRDIAPRRNGQRLDVEGRVLKSFLVDFGIVLQQVVLDLAGGALFDEDRGRDADIVMVRCGCLQSETRGVRLQPETPGHGLLVLQVPNIVDAS